MRDVGFDKLFIGGGLYRMVEFYEYFLERLRIMILIFELVDVRLVDKFFLGIFFFDLIWI